MADKDDGRPIIAVEGLVKRYGDHAAVDDISFSVDAGDFFGFLGPNGAGKTTTMRILATLLRKTGGAARVAGYDVDRDPDGVRRSIGFAMQEISLDSMASGWENLQLLGVLYGLSPREAKARAADLLEVVGLSKVAGRWVNTYSGGMRRRLDLAGVLMHHPRVLFLDEPTQGLDPQARRVIYDYLQRLNQDEGMTVFLTTHYMDEADALCRELAFIDKGRIVRQGTPQELKSEMGGDIVTLRFRPDTPLGAAERAVRAAAGDGATVERRDDDRQITAAVRDADRLVPRLIADLDAVGTPPASLSVAQPSLEDVFVKLVGRSILEDDESGLVKGRDPFVQGAG
jgi:ABC-2 type transport system ATP-binding protein